VTVGNIQFSLDALLDRVIYNNYTTWPSNFTLPASAVKQD